MFYQIVTIVLAGVLTAFVAGNNISAAVGTIVGSRIISRTGGILIGMLGFIIGLLLEGRQLEHAVNALIPHSYPLISYALFISFIIFVAAALTRSPLSLTMALVGASAGISLKIGYSADFGFLRFLIFTWILAPILSIVFAYVANMMLQKKDFRNTWRAAVIIKISLLVASFLTAFTLGANTIGFIAGFAGYNIPVLGSMILGIVVGTLFLSKGVMRRVGEEMYIMRYTNAFVSLIVSSVLVEAATIFGVPLSNTQTLTSSVFGTGLSYRFKAMYIRPFIIVIITWIVSPLFGFLMGLLV